MAQAGGDIDLANILAVYAAELTRTDAFDELQTTYALQSQANIADPDTRHALFQAESAARNAQLGSTAARFGLVAPAQAVAVNTITGAQQNLIDVSTALEQLQYDLYQYRLGEVEYPEKLIPSQITFLIEQLEQQAFYLQLNGQADAAARISIQTGLLEAQRALQNVKIDVQERRVRGEPIHVFEPSLRHELLSAQNSILGVTAQLNPMVAAQVSDIQTVNDLTVLTEQRAANAAEFLNYEGPPIAATGWYGTDYPLPPPATSLIFPETRAAYFGPGRLGVSPYANIEAAPAGSRRRRRRQPERAFGGIGGL